MSGGWQQQQQQQQVSPLKRVCKYFWLFFDTRTRIAHRRRLFSRQQQQRSVRATLRVLCRADGNRLHPFSFSTFFFLLLLETFFFPGFPLGKYTYNIDIFFASFHLSLGRPIAAADATGVAKRHTRGAGKCYYKGEDETTTTTTTRSMPPSTPNFCF